MFKVDKKRLLAFRENVEHCTEDRSNADITTKTLTETKEDIFPETQTKLIHEFAEKQVSRPVCQQL